MALSYNDLHTASIRAVTSTITGGTDVDNALQNVRIFRMYCDGGGGTGNILFYDATSVASATGTEFVFPTITSARATMEFTPNGYHFDNLSWDPNNNTRLTILYIQE